MLFKTNDVKAKERKFEEKLYAQVAEELHKGEKYDAIWAKSLSFSEGNLEKAKGLYISYRIQSLKDDFIIENERKESIFRKERERYSAKKSKIFFQKVKNFTFSIILTFLLFIIYLILISFFLYKEHDRFADLSGIGLLVFLFVILPFIYSLKTKKLN